MSNRWSFQGKSRQNPLTGVVGDKQLADHPHLLQSCWSCAAAAAAAQVRAALPLRGCVQRQCRALLLQERALLPGDFLGELCGTTGRRP
eukprot:CAMPEP_0172181062 /NCGR_PEP_ID=MMETSP1050-20130122/17604_1 /TAXON_ID=233186 /ORGANISM="Cryptomonas curvata, Strain CCAP979/52" /LENGTH=88 /DNA_ID=CAMNT_0012854293 /DNA_START=283 /DNA_END=545 /DNA_ORIENTATION=-